MFHPKKITKQAHGLLSEFRSFAVKGNALELAFAVIIGNAFGAIVNSLVADIITPVLGFFTGSGGADVKNLAITLRHGQASGGQAASDIVLHYGAFLQTTINFLIISLSIFLVFKLLSSARKKLLRQEEKATSIPKQPAQERLLEEIRDLLKQGK